MRRLLLYAVTAEACVQHIRQQGPHTRKKLSQNSFVGLPSEPVELHVKHCACSSMAQHRLSTALAQHSTWHSKRSLLHQTSLSIYQHFNRGCYPTDFASTLSTHTAPTDFDTCLCFLQLQRHPPCYLHWQLPLCSSLLHLSQLLTKPWLPQHMMQPQQQTPAIRPRPCSRPQLLGDTFLQVRHSSSDLGACWAHLQALAHSHQL